MFFQRLEEKKDTLREKKVTYRQIFYTDSQQEKHLQNVRHIHSLETKHSGKIC
jgi:hypothetical protein